MEHIVPTTVITVKENIAEVIQAYEDKGYEFLPSVNPDTPTLCWEIDEFHHTIKPTRGTIPKLTILSYSTPDIIINKIPLVQH